MDLIDSDEISVIAYVLLYRTPPCAILTCEIDGNRHLPTFYYSNDRPYTPDSCCDDLKELLNLPLERIIFRPVVELLPKEEDGCSAMYNPGGNVHLLHLEALSPLDRFIDSTVNHIEWVSCKAFLDLLLSEDYQFDYQFAFYNLATSMKSCARVGKALSSFQCDHIWTTHAEGYLNSVGHDLGAPPVSVMERESWMSISRLFKINTTSGWYHLKSQPYGCAEASITACIAELFREDTLQVVAVNNDLKCFVSRGFHELGRLDAENGMIIARKLARIQIQSLEHIGKLTQAGCPDHSPATLATEVDQWVENPAVMKLFDETGVSTEAFRTIVKRVCKELDSSVIPMALVHGDFGEHNCAYREDVLQDKGIIFFDWETASLSHPFCDLFKTTILSPEDVDEYLSAWERYVDLEEGKRLMKVAKKVGCVVSIAFGVKFVMDAPEEDHSAIANLVRSCVNRLLN